jgi:enterochelin esterase-like enzyme
MYKRQSIPTWTLSLLLLFRFLITESNAQQQQRVRWDAPPEEWYWVDSEEVPGLFHDTVMSQSMKREVGYNIFLPPGYEKDKSKRFPVVYFLHGAGGTERSDADPSVVRRLIRDGKLGDVIYVYPNGGHFSRYRDWDNAYVKSETFIIKELIPHIDSTYRTIAERDGRALSGWSMGGDASLRFAFKYPDMFCAAATISAAIDWGAKPGDADTVFGHSRRNIEKIRGRTALLMVVGEDDRLFGSHKRLMPHLDELKIDYSFQSYEGIDHNLGLMKQKSAEQITLMLAKHYASAK